MKRVVFRPGEGGFDAFYTITNREERPIHIRFGVEFALGSMAGEARDRYYRIQGQIPADPRLRSRGIDEGVTEFSASDEWLKVEAQFAMSEPCMLWRFPLETVSLSEGGFELLYQGSILLPNWRISLSPASEGESSRAEYKVSQKIRHW